MILRILVPDSASSVPLGEKFGAAPESIPTLVHEALDLGLPVIGVSFHCGSGCHDPEAYGTAIRIARDGLDVVDGILKERLGSGSKRCTLLDIGGGYPGWDGVGGDVGRFSGGVCRQPICLPGDGGDEDDEYREEGDCSIDINEEKEKEEEDTTYKISQVVTPLINELFPPATDDDDDDNDTGDINPPLQIIAEPGRYFVEAAFAYCARIYTTRIDDIAGDDNGAGGGGKQYHYYIAQGVRGLFKDVLLCGETFTPIPLVVDEERIYNHQRSTTTDINTKSYTTTDDDVTEMKPKTEEEDKQSQPQSQVLYPSTVHGPSGESFDIVCQECHLPALKIGDWLIFDRMGAYTISIAARNSCLPIRYVFGSGGGV